MEIDSSVQFFIGLSFKLLQLLTYFNQTWSQGHNVEGQGLYVQGQGLDLQGQDQGQGLGFQSQGQTLDLQVTRNPLLVSKWVLTYTDVLSM